MLNLFSVHFSAENSMRCYAVKEMAKLMLSCKQWISLQFMRINDSSFLQSLVSTWNRMCGTF